MIKLGKGRSIGGEHMPSRPGWYSDYWKNMDKDTGKKIQTTCPRCGSDKTYYNEKFRIWRCGSCENSFLVKGYGSQRPWWKRLLHIK